MNISVFAKPLIASSIFRKAFAVANDQQDRMAQFRTNVQMAYENMCAIDRTALSADFTNTPESFNKVMGFCFVTLGEIFQAEFNADITRGAKPQFAGIPLVAVALLPYSHKCVAKNNNSRTGRLVDQKFGCPRLAKYYRLLNSAAKDLMSILVSTILSDNPAGLLFISCQLNPKNLHKRMEETRKMLKEHYSTEGDLLMKQWAENIGMIGNIPPTTPGFGGAVIAFAATLCLE